MIVGGLDRKRAARFLGYNVEEFSRLVAANCMPAPHHVDGLEYWWEDVLANAAPSNVIANSNAVRRFIWPSVYFIGMQVSPFAKVGWTRCVPQRRLDLQCANPERLVVLGSVCGDKRHEAAFHRVLKPYRAHGEWFHKGAWLDAALKALAAPAVTPEYLLAVLEAHDA